MQIFTLSGNLKLLSLNAAFITLRNGRRARSKEYAQFARSLAVLMIGRERDLIMFNEAYNPKIHEIHACLKFWTPDLYTRVGTISKNSLDVGNVEKCIMDNVLTGKIDDSAITSLKVQKFHGADHCFELSLSIVLRV